LPCGHPDRSQAGDHVSIEEITYVSVAATRHEGFGRLPPALWGWSAAGGVFVAEAAGPDVVAVGEGLVGPSVFVALAVVVST
jgi:hypothetical protein